MKPNRNGLCSLHAAHLFIYLDTLALAQTFKDFCSIKLGYIF